MGLFRLHVAAVIVIVGLSGCSRDPIAQSGAGGTGVTGEAGRGGSGSGGASGSVGGVAGISGSGGLVGGISGTGGAVGGTSGSGGAGGTSGVGGTAGAGGPAGAPGNGDCTTGADICPTGLVCERYPPPACADPQWVAWPMPNGSGDVAAGAPNPMSFTDNGDGTVTDNVTRLMWQQAAPVTAHAWAAASSYCADLSLAAHSDWRLPSLVELTSIADLGQSNPAIDVTYFPATAAAEFWSSSVWGASPTTASGVNFATGGTRQQPLTAAHNVRCVR